MAFKSYQGPDFAFESLVPEQGPVSEQLSAWSRRARAAGRVPCAYLTASWCPPSVKLECSLSDPRMQRALREVEAATFDIDEWSTPLTEAGFAVRTVPVFFILDGDGKPTGASITGAAWGENVPEEMAPPLERFFDAARGARPAPAVPEARASGGSRLRGTLMVVGAVAAIVGAAWLKVSSDERDSRAQADSERAERIQRDVQQSIQRSLEAQKHK